jgi:hypothetical protein
MLMKKIHFTILACAITFSTFAQLKFAQITGPEKDHRIRQEQVKPDQVSPSSETVPGQKLFDNAIIGTTWYDLQSYTNVMQRIWAYPDGTVGATWMSAGQNLVPERGAGYNYYNGSVWGTPNLHVGPADRMGWPSYAPFGPNGEIIALYKYVAGSGPIKFFKRENKGQGDWIESELTPPAGVSLVWHSMMTSGDNHEFIHLLAYTYDIEYQGQTNALLYYRSSDGGQTWEIDGEVIDGLSSSDFPTIHSLTYAWANPVGETIAFTLGFDEWGGWVFKSYDNGDSWEKIQVMETTLDPFDLPANSDNIPCGTGNSSIVLDKQGNAHIVFSRMVKIYSGDTLYYYPFTDGLIYWNESMPMIDTTLISSYTLDFLDAAGNLCGYVLSSQPTFTIPSGQPSYQNSLCAFPQLSIDAQDNLFVASSMLAPDFSNTTYFYRHIIANSSFDMGNSWGGQIDLNGDLQYIFSECAYPEMAPVIDDYIHVAFQEDAFPGIAEWLTNHEKVQNNIMYMKIDKDVFVGLKENTETLPFEFSISPNPGNSVSFLNLKLDKPGNISVDILNQVGQSVYSSQTGTYSEGQHLIRLDVSDLPAGIYYCVVKSEGKQTTKKIVVMK